MEKISVLLNNSLSGWMLVQSYRYSEPKEPFTFHWWMTQLYGEDFNSLKPSERAFMKGEPIEKVIAHLKDVCKGLNFSMSVCGKKSNPTIRLWKRHPLENHKPQPEEISVDLKWSCWTTGQGYWEEYAPGVWQKMLSAFKGETVPVKIYTGPRKVIRYGLVEIEKGKACGHFSSNWDECYQLAETLGTECDDAFVEMIPHSAHLMEPGIDWDFGPISARSFARLMQRIDEQEDELMSLDKEAWQSIESLFSPRDVFTKPAE